MFEKNDEYGVITKKNTAKSFLSVRQAFVFKCKDVSKEKYENVGKILLEFGKYEDATNTIKYFLNMEDASYLAEILKTWKIEKLCKDNKGVGYHVMAGTATSKQLKIQKLDGEDKYFFSALEGPGEKSATGLTVPKYTAQTADKKLAIPLNREQLTKIGLSIERAIRCYDMWNSCDKVIERCKERGYVS